MRILVVEDILEIRTLLAEVLREEGHDVTEAADMTTAIAALTALPACDAVIADAVLPDGFSGLKIVAAARAAGIPALACTGNSDAMMLLEANGVPHLRKPFRLDEIFDWIAGLGGAAQAPRPVRRNRRPPSGSRETA